MYLSLECHDPNSLLNHPKLTDDFGRWPMVEAPLDHCYYSSGSVCLLELGRAKENHYFFFSKGRSCVVRKLFKTAYHEKFEEIMPRAKGEIVLFLILIVACVK